MSVYKAQAGYDFLSLFRDITAALCLLVCVINMQGARPVGEGVDYMAHAPLLVLQLLHVPAGIQLVTGVILGGLRSVSFPPF